MINDSIREKIIKFNKEGINRYICEEDGKAVLHVAGEKWIDPKPEFVDDVVVERYFNLFVQSCTKTKEEMEKIGYCIDETKGAPLMFHGTSTFFLDLIKRNGFNKRNFFEEYGLKEMMLELEQACIEHKILLESYWESRDNIEETFINNCNYIKKEWNNNEIVAKLNGDLYFNIRHIKKDTKNYQYGSLYLTSSIHRGYMYAKQEYIINGKKVIRGSLGEFLNQIMNIYIMYRQITGEMYLFKKPEHNELIEKVYDVEKNCVAEWIQPVVIVIKDIPWEDLQTEVGESGFLEMVLFKLLKLHALTGKKLTKTYLWVPKEDYIGVQESARYAGNDIPPEKLDIIEFKDDTELKTKIYEKYEIKL